MYLGLDIGSSSSKAVLLGENQESLAAQVVNLGTGTKGVGQVLEALLFSDTSVFLWVLCQI